MNRNISSWIRKIKIFLQPILEFKEKIIFDKILLLAKNGDLESMNHIAWYYYIGIGVPQNMNDAVYWWARSAELDYFPSIFNLSTLVIVKNNELWPHYLKIPLTEVGGCFEAPMLIQCIGESAHNCVETDENIICSKMLLGLIYYLGIGVKPDRNESMVWLKLAKRGKKDSPAKQFMLKNIGYDFMESLTKSSKSGDLGAITAMGFLYSSGINVPVDKVKASEYWLQAANQGFAPIYRKLVDVYSEGLGVEINKVESAFWWGMCLNPDKKITDERHEPGRNWLPPNSMS